MQRKAADFSRLPVMIESVEEELQLLKEDRAEWWTEVKSLVESLEKEHEISIRSAHLSTRSKCMYIYY